MISALSRNKLRAVRVSGSVPGATMPRNRPAAKSVQSQSASGSETLSGWEMYKRDVRANDPTLTESQQLFFAFVPFALAGSLMLAFLIHLVVLAAK